MQIAENPIKKHYAGLPCMLGDVVGRIVGEDESGSWGVIDGERVFSIPKFSTPHGTIFKVGRFYLSEITEEGMKQLTAYEEELKAKGEKLYAGLLDKTPKQSELTKWTTFEGSYSRQGMKGIIMLDEEGDPSRIFSVLKDGDMFEFCEECDDHFSVTLSKADALKLVDELRQWIESQ